MLVYLIAFRRLDYIDTFTVFLFPWLLIIGLSMVNWSLYAHPIHPETYWLILVSIFTAMIASGAPTRARETTLHWAKARSARFKSKDMLIVLDVIFISLTIANIILAGYVPLVRGLTSGNTGYLDFGLHGFYGFYLAFGNAFAIFNLVLYLRTRRPLFIVHYSMVIVVFVLFVTRQNLISAAVESVVVYSVLRRRIGWKVIMLLILVASFTFSIIGSFRSGDIKELAGIRAQYAWVPDSLIWLYSYSYFNIANVDNMMRFSDAPFYNGSSFASLVPSFIRPTYDMPSYLQTETFNVSSYLYPIYEDAGIVGVVILTFVSILFTNSLYKRIYIQASLKDIGSFAMLYFCAAFSFFFNFWFFLPIIAQAVFFKLLSNLCERVVADRARIERQAFVTLHEADSGGLC